MSQDEMLLYQRVDILCQLGQKKQETKEMPPVIEKNCHDYTNMYVRK